MTKKFRKLAVVESKVYDARPSLPRATREVYADYFMINFLGDVQSSLTKSTEQVEKFSQRLLANAAEAFEWSHSVFEYAAEQAVSRAILQRVQLLTENADEYACPSNLSLMVSLRDWLRSEVMSAARYPSRSSSPQHNEMKTSLMAAQAKFLEVVDSKLNWYNLEK